MTTPITNENPKVSVQGEVTAQVGRIFWVSFDVGVRPKITYAQIQLGSEEMAKELFGRNVLITLEVIDND